MIVPTTLLNFDVDLLMLDQIPGNHTHEVSLLLSLDLEDFGLWVAFRVASVVGKIAGVRDAENPIKLEIT